MNVHLSNAQKIIISREKGIELDQICFEIICDKGVREMVFIVGRDIEVENKEAL